MTDLTATIARVRELDAAATRLCRACGASRPLEMFHRAADKRLGRRYTCKPCLLRRQRRVALAGVKALPEYNVWCNMIARCHRPSAGSYKWYGAKGITVAAEWRGAGGFRRFLEHVGARPSATHQIDRVKTEGNYEPGNVRWATAQEQAENRTRWTPGAEGICLKKLCGERGVRYATLVSRMYRGMTLEQALSGTVDRRRRGPTV